ncbi:MAG: sodium:alanine symporter family protein [Oscillospiraceae bacterium]|nr:sodium:alanine symporter family protein [Oscillospiraceae bacterium]MBR2929037.1 sodium:alanine symporter family protein [Oscillospiraceae bacterium]
MEMIAQINGTINGLVWGVPAMILIVGTGVYMTIGIGFKQFTRFGYVMKNTIGKAFTKHEVAEGAVTPFQALCTALAATVGTGNIAGVCGAIAIGGPGAVFWMWVSAIFGMATKYSEVTLSIKYREKNDKGDWVGGPMYYIRNGLGKSWGWLAAVFAVFATLAAFGIGNATQANTIASSISEAIKIFNPDVNVGTINLVVGVVLCVLALVVYLGGIKRIGQVCELLVPVMAVIYIVAGIGVVVIRADQIPSVFAAIFKGAFEPAAIAGGLAGATMADAIKKGVGRGVFSNEAGLGSAPIAHAAADVDHPVQQGIFGIFEVFADTIVICTLTALIAMCGNGIENIPFGQAANQTLTVAGFCSVYPATIATVAVAIALSLFAFSTILSWGLYGSRTAEFLFGAKAVKPYQIIFSLVCIVGTTIDLSLAWDIADTLNGLMAIPNLVGVLLLSPVVFKLTKEYFAKVDAEKKAAK